jgi:hypothetical protein
MTINELPFISKMTFQTLNLINVNTLLLIRIFILFCKATHPGRI